MIHNRSSTPAAAQVPQDGTQQGTDPPRLPSFHPDMSPLCCILLAATLLQLQERALSLYVPLRPATPTVPYRQRRNHAAAPRPICMASGSGLGGDEESKNFLQSLLGDDYELVNSGMSYEVSLNSYDNNVLSLPTAACCCCGCCCRRRSWDMTPASRTRRCCETSE